MFERLQPLLLTGAMAGLGLALALALRHSASETLPPAGPGVSVARNVRFQQVQVVGRVDGVKAWELDAPLVETSGDRQRLDFSGGIRATLYQNGIARARCQAPSAHYDAGSQTLAASGGVRLHLEPPPVEAVHDLPRALGVVDLATERIAWRVDSRELTAPGTVQITFSQGHEARVDSLRLNLQTRALDTTDFRARFLVKDLEL